MLLGAEFLAPLAMLDQMLGVLQSSRPEETMAESIGDKGSGGRVVAALTLVDVFEDCFAPLWLYAALEHISDAAPNKLSVYYGVCCCSALHLPGQGLVGW